MIQAATPEQVRRITQDILSRPEFRQNQTWTQFLIENVFRWLRAIAEWSGQNPGLYKVLVVTLTIILAVVREFASLRESSADERSRRSLGALEGVAENWTEAFRLAKAALNAGDLYRALWITHRILLSALDRMDRVKFARWKTNTDYIRECRGGDAASETLAEVTAAYEKVVYAHHEFDRDQAARFVAKVEALAGEAAR